MDGGSNRRRAVRKRHELDRLVSAGVRIDDLRHFVATELEMSGRLPPHGLQSSGSRPDFETLDIYRLRRRRGSHRGGVRLRAPNVTSSQVGGLGHPARALDAPLSNPQLALMISSILHRAEPASSSTPTLEISRFGRFGRRGHRLSGATVVFHADHIHTSRNLVVPGVRW